MGLMSHKFPFLIFCLSLALLLLIKNCNCTIKFNGIPAAFGNLDLNRRTDIVYIAEDGKTLTVLYQHEPQQEESQSPKQSCFFDDPIAQVYINDINSDGEPNLLALLNKKGHYELVSLTLKRLNTNDLRYSKTKLTSNTAYLMSSPAALTSDKISDQSNSNNSMSNPLALVSIPEQIPRCDSNPLGIELKYQPLLFDLDGDLRTDFMGLDLNGVVTVWKSSSSGDKQFTKWRENWISKVPPEYLEDPHSNAFIDINHDQVADIVFSAKNLKFGYVIANSTATNYFNPIVEYNLDKGHTYGQSSLVDIDADGKIDHVIPRCSQDTKTCDIVMAHNNGKLTSIFSFKNVSHYDYRLQSQRVGDYQFPIMLRSSDLDGDGYTDFVAVAKDIGNSTTDVIYLHNIPRPDDNRPKQQTEFFLNRTFKIHIVDRGDNPEHAIIVTLFDVNEDGKVDMLIGRSNQSYTDVKDPKDIQVYAEMNKQMVDACFMKVLVTNGISNNEGSYGQSARGSSICFELSQNDGNRMQGCAGQQAQASHFALQQPYVIFGLGQTPHFVEKLVVFIPGYGPDGNNRNRTLEQIVPDAQIIIIPRDPNNPLSWDYKMFLSPMSELVPPTLIALTAICVLLMIIIFFLHRQETLEDAAEHEEYKRHWPESRG